MKMVFLEKNNGYASYNHLVYDTAKEGGMHELMERMLSHYAHLLAFIVTILL